MDHVFRLPRRRLRHLGDRAGRRESAQAHVGAIRRAGAGGGADGSRCEIAGRAITGTENVFAFRATFPRGAGDAFYYVSDGKIRKRSVSGADVQTVPFSATMTVTQASTMYTRRKRDF